MSSFMTSSDVGSSRPIYERLGRSAMQIFANHSPRRWFTQRIAPRLRACRLLKDQSALDERSYTLSRKSREGTTPSREPSTESSGSSKGRPGDVKPAIREVRGPQWCPRRFTAGICQLLPSTEAELDVRSNVKRKRIFRGIFLSTCFIIAARLGLHRKVGVLAPTVAVLVGSSVLHTRGLCVESGASQNVGHPQLKSQLGFGDFPQEIQRLILRNLPYEQVFQLKSVSKGFKALAESFLLDSDDFQASLSRNKSVLTASYFFIDGGVWKWAGFDPASKRWRLLPPLTILNLPGNCNPDPDLFKEFLFCANNGLVCVNFSKSPDRERLVVFNPLSGVSFELPPLNHRRNPVLMHLLVDPCTKAYQVIVAGSSKSGDEGLSRITEVFDSCTGIWNRTGDLLGPAFALNEFQSGAYQDGKLFCIGFVEANDGVGKGIMAYDVEQCTWSSKWRHLLPFSTSPAILQLVENFGEVFLFSEREIGRSIQHWVDKVEWTQANEGTETHICVLTNVIQDEKSSGRSLEVYPESIAVPYDEGRLCIVNTIDHSGKVFDVWNRGQEGVPLPGLPAEGFRGGVGFFSLNPLSFTVQPRFNSEVCRRNNQVQRADLGQAYPEPGRPTEGPKGSEEGGGGNNTNYHSDTSRHTVSMHTLLSASVLFFDTLQQIMSPLFYSI